MNRRNNDYFFQLSLVTLLCAYAIIGNNAIKFNIGWIPTFNMSLFINEPDVVSHYMLRFTEINGEVLSEPITFDSAGDWIQNRKVVVGEELINRLGIALHQEDELTAAQLHTQLIADYFNSLTSAEYEIVFIVVNPVEKYNEESFTIEEAIWSFVYDDGTPQEITMIGDKN